MRGAAVIAGTVTQATFRGPPIVCCSSDYDVPFNAACWQNLLVLAAQLDAPAIHTDAAHDGTEAPVLAALHNLQRFYTPGCSAPWIDRDGATQTPICGPIFYFDGTSPNPSTDVPGSGGWLANRVSLNSTNFRRNQIHGYACEAVWPNLDDQALFGPHALEYAQRPPIHRFFTNMGVSDPNWFLIATLPQWQAPQPNGQVVREQLTRGYEELRVRSVTYPGIERHINPNYISPLPTDLFVWPWSI